MNVILPVGVPMVVLMRMKKWPLVIIIRIEVLEQMEVPVVTGSNSSSSSLPIQHEVTDLWVVLEALGQLLRVVPQPVLGIVMTEITYHPIVAKVNTMLYRRQQEVFDQLEAMTDQKKGGRRTQQLHLYVLAGLKVM